MTRADSYFVVCKAERRGSIPSQSDRCCVARTTRRGAKDIRRELCYFKLNKYRPCRSRTPAPNPVHLFPYTRNTMARVRNMMARVRNKMTRDFKKNSVINFSFLQYSADPCHDGKDIVRFSICIDTCHKIIGHAFKKRSGARAEKESSGRLIRRENSKTIGFCFHAPLPLRSTASRFAPIAAYLLIKFTLHSLSS